MCIYMVEVDVQIFKLDFLTCASRVLFIIYLHIRLGYVAFMFFKCLLVYHITVLHVLIYFCVIACNVRIIVIVIVDRCVCARNRTVQFAVASQVYLDGFL